MLEKPLRPPSTVYDMIFASGQNPNAVAIEDPDGRKTTYGQLHEHVRNTVGTLNNAGFRRNDRIIITLPDGPEMIVAIATFSCGFTTIPLNPNLTASEYGNYMRYLYAKSLIIEKGSGIPVRQVAKDLGIEIIDIIKSGDGRAGIFSLAGFDSGKGEAPEFGRPEDIANVLLTSGTTSKPKKVPWTHSMVCWGHYLNQLSLPFGPSDRHLIMNRLFYAGGVNHIYRPLYTGGTIIYTGGFVRAEFFRWLERTKPTVFSSPPAAHQFIIEMAKDRRDVISNSKIRMIRSGTAALPSTVIRELEETFGVPVVESYNASEVTGIGLTPYCMGHEPGAFVPTVPEIMIMDEEGNALTQGELGEIAVRGPNVFKGYEDDPDANKAAFINGWFRTGDLGFIDKKGYLHLGGRAKDVINKGGEKVSPQEVDNVLMEHPAVAEALTFPVPHPTLGEDLNVAVVVRQGGQVTETELRRFLFQKLSYFKVPTRILFVEEIPKGPTGKASRKDMARLMSSDK